MNETKANKQMRAFGFYQALFISTCVCVYV